MAGSALRGLALIALAGACSDSAAPVAAASEPPERDLSALLAFEHDRRAATSFATLPASDDTLGPDPYRIAALPSGGLVGLLRGDSMIVALDPKGVERARVAAPRSPSGLAVTPGGEILVVGDGERGIARYRFDGDRLARIATVAVDALGLRDIALSSDESRAYVVEEREGRLLEVSRAGGDVRELGRCHGPVRVAAVVGYVVVDCLLDHTLEIRRDGDPAVVRIRHDGPIWGFALHRQADGGLLVAATGVEDHPLEREDGGFGYIDSFLYMYELPRAAMQAKRLVALNVSALGTITPKWLALDVGAGGDVTVTTAGYASADLLAVTWPAGRYAGAPIVGHRALVPGTADARLDRDGTVIAANPVFDAWVIEAPRAQPQLVPVASPHPTRPLPSRLGELLFFTTMMAPWNSSEGKLSRFTCETCHFEGYVDGRTHFTGRADIHATTKPLHGLFNNRPYFSRALDKTMGEMVDAEFRVANRHNGRDPWFALTRADVPWLAEVDGAPATLTPEVLRTSLMSFLMDFTHRENPAAHDHAQLTELERSGAAVFRDRCASCHAPRLVADDPESAVRFEDWPALVLSPAGPIVWATSDYAQTGVVPYVHPLGTRVPSLRRLYKKWPYFTNGSATSLTGVLDRFAWLGARSYHDGAPADAERLPEADKVSVRAFLDLL